MSTRLQAAVSKQPSNNFSRFEVSLIDQKQWLLEFSQILGRQLNGETLRGALLEIQDVLGQVDELEHALQHLKTVIATPPEPSREHLANLLQGILHTADEVDDRTPDMQLSGELFGLASPGPLWTRELDSLHSLLTKAQRPLFRYPM